MRDWGATFWPARKWLGNVNSNSLKADAFAGFSNAAIVIPQGVAFATIAGLPPELGLYTAMITAAVAALWGSSMVMISGPTTAISAVVYTTIQDFAQTGTSMFVEMALMITIIVGVVQLVAGLARLGGLVSFVSHSVMTGFTTAAAILIGISQLPGALGIKVHGGGNVIERLVQLFEGFHGISGLSVLIAGVTLGSLILLQLYLKKLPGFLIALILGAVLSLALNGSDNGIAMVPAITAALPSIAVPSVGFESVIALVPGAMAIALVGLLEAISIGRSFAIKRNERFDANQEMIGQGLSNIVGGFFRCYAGSGSFTRSGVNAEAGAQTPLSAVFSSVFLAIILLLFSDYIRFIPIPAMSALILYVAWRLVNFKEIRHVLESSRSETIILLATLMAGLFIELDFAIYVGVIASFSVYIYQSSHPSIRISSPVVIKSGRRKFRNADLHKIPECPQIIMMRLDGSLYFGSVEYVEREFQKIRKQRPKQIHVLFYLKGVGRIDLAGADFLIDAIREVKAAGGSFHIIALFPPLLENLRRFHVIDEIGEDHLHICKGDAIEAVINEIDTNICKTCTKRVFVECENLPGADAFSKST